MVFIKTVPLNSKESQEYDIWRMLDRPEARLHPDNHTVPVREVLYFNPNFALAGVEPELTDARLFVVMERFDKVTPLDGPSSYPGYPFIRTVEDLCRLFLQIAQAVRYMHDLGIAHQDLRDKNFLIDRASTVDRCYVIDFQFSLYFPRPWAAVPKVLIDADAPEASQPTKPYNPFPVDVFGVGSIFGKMIRAHQLAGWTSLAELSGIAGSMCQWDPELRPTIHAVQNYLEDLIQISKSPMELKHPDRRLTSAD
ncbi:hypothetical protein FRC01_007291 [Tulasnella sp. 417]|nr:hypothetical protein FRC01_007291 [Tulasnella sp. 417]